MILHYDDWQKYPSAIVHNNTKNKSFLEQAKVYKLIGVKNHAFLLALHNPILEFIDPHDKNLSEEMIGYIAEEVAINPWYYIRECVKVTAKSGIGNGPFEANRGNISLYWLFFNNVAQLLIMIRQTGKTYGVATLFRGLLNFWVLNTQANLLTKDIKLRTDTVELMKEIEKGLPSYLQMTNRKDTDNKEGITVNVNNNTYKTTLAQSSLSAALNAARGLTSGIFHIDELAYLYNIEHMLAPALASGAKARDNAKKANMPYGTIMTTTSGRRDLPAGEFAYGIYSTGAEFSELLYDIGSKEKLKKYARQHTLKGNSPIIVAEFNHRQLGKTDEWLEETMEESMSTGLDAEADFFNGWPTGGSSSPLDAKYLTIITESEEEVKYLGISGEGYTIRWHVDEDTVKNILPNMEIVIGADTSDAVGSDDIALVFREVKTGKVIGAGQYNDLNTIEFGKWLASIMLWLSKSVLIMERRSTGTSIMDTIILELLAKDVDPYRRMFNWVVQDSDINPGRYDEINGKVNSSVYTKFRKDIGFATSGSGATARKRLYGETLLDSVKFTGGVVKDKRLILQITGLKDKGGRVDHGGGKDDHDDLVIAWLLSYWFLSKAKNVTHYGMNHNNLLSNVATNSVNVKEDLETSNHINRQVKLKQDIENLLTTLKLVNNHLYSAQLIRKIQFLNSKVDTKVISNVNIDAAIAEVVKNVNISTKDSNRKRMRKIPKMY